MTTVSDVVQGTPSTQTFSPPGSFSIRSDENSISDPTVFSRSNHAVQQTLITVLAPQEENREDPRYSQVNPAPETPRQAETAQFVPDFRFVPEAYRGNYINRTNSALSLIGADKPLLDGVNKSTIVIIPVPDLNRSPVAYFKELTSCAN